MVHSTSILVKASDPELSLQQVGNLIREARLKADLTQKDLALKLGVSTPTVNKFEKNGHQLTIGTLSKIARVLEVDLVVGFLT
ncbi:helix-turn-helix transcriptional regulator [Larkinella bovis]|uniref:Helix-turn-helix transcriptional regulator n=1 Tax=Larkinella bovis TaxID=683041 RepID=A0ABW0I6V2_9BACT